MKNVLRAILYLKSYWPAAAGTTISLLLVNAANLVTPQILRTLIDQGITPLEMRYVWIATLSFLGVAIVRGVFTFFQGYLSEVASQGVAYDLRNSIFEKLQNLSFSYHDQSQTGKLMTRMTSDVELVRMFVGQGALQLFSALIMLLGTIVVLFAMNWLLALIILAVIPGIMVILFMFISKIIPLSSVVQQRLAALNTVLQENIAGIRTVKSFAREVL